jgi:hypothetical protein
MTDPARTVLRHTLATLAYRAGKALRDAPPDFAGFRIGDTSRTPVQILAHMGDLFDWALHMARGTQVWMDSEPLPWDREVERFFEAVARLDAFLASDEPMTGSVEIVFQGPVADALTHVGQINMLRRLAGAPVRGENYARAEIAAGRVGAEQSAPRREFD